MAKIPLDYYGSYKIMGNQSMDIIMKASKVWTLFFVFVGHHGGWSCTKPGKIQKVDLCTHTTNQ